MPKAFDNCVKNGGKVVTKSLKGNKYINICYDKDGNSHAGEVKTKKSNSSKDKVKDSKAIAEKLRDLKKHFDENYRN